MNKNYFWAKKREVDGRLLWLPLRQHLEDTRNVAGLLWEHWLGEGQKKLVKTALETAHSKDDLSKRLIQFLAASHDIGKATPAFQTQAGYANSRDLDLRLLERLERAGFEGISSLELASPRKSHHSLAGQYLLTTYGVGEDLTAIIGGHHGRPIDTNEICEEQKSYATNYFQTEQATGAIYQKWAQAQREIFDWALATSGFASREELPKITQPAQVILLGLLIMADWIASNETYFPLIDIDTLEVPDKAARTEKGYLAWKRSGLWEANLQDTAAVFKSRFGFSPREVQVRLSDLIVNSEAPGIFILEAPMGIGKTEAALVAAEQLAAKTGRNGLYFGLPTQATSNGIFSRIEKWVEKLSVELDDPLSIHLVHGKAALNDDFATLPRSTNINMDDMTDGNVVVNEWFSGRKTAALDDFVVGTVDQFLMVALKQKHLMLRHLGFSRKVIVIDEVQAYDAYMSQYLLAAVEWMGAYGVPVIILSATLPQARRLDLVRHYLAGKGQKFGKSEKRQLAEQLETTAYPLITYTDGNEIYQEKTFSKESSRNITIHRLQEEELFDLIESQISDGGVVGVMVNTVRRAQELAKDLVECFGEEIVELLHSGFIATARIEKEQALLKMIGKKVDRPHRKIIVGTQVIEQSLDIDFDVLISDLAPMDLLIQRMGRLHRHDIARPAQHQQARFYVLGTNAELTFEPGAAFVYGDYLLARTQYFLPERMRLPEDISVLVQQVYDDTVVDFENELLNEKYLQAKQAHKQSLDQQKRKAKTYRIASPILKETRLRKANLIGWLKNENPEDSEEKAYAQVRDIEETIEVIALKKMGTGYGYFGQSEDISDKINDNKVAQQVAQYTLRLPQSLSKSYNIDQTIRFLETYNSHHLANWRETTWLKGALGIIFDENNECVINGRKLCYNEEYGISMEEVGNESI